MGASTTSFRTFLVAICFSVLFNVVTIRGNEKITTVTIKENGSTVTLQKGGLLEVTLPASPGTGYSWRLRKSTFGLLRSRGKPLTKKGDTEAGKVGGTEYQVFQFDAQEVGSEKLELEYVRPWEKDGSPAKIFALTVLVK
jgi:predicted secreted protein